MGIRPWEFKSPLRHRVSGGATGRGRPGRTSGKSLDPGVAGARRNPRGARGTSPHPSDAVTRLGVSQPTETARWAASRESVARGQAQQREDQPVQPVMGESWEQDPRAVDGDVAAQASAGGCNCVRQAVADWPPGAIPRQMTPSTEWGVFGPRLSGASFFSRLIATSDF